MIPLKRWEGDQFVLMDYDFNVIDHNPTPGVQAKWAQLEIRSVQHTGTNFLNQLLRNHGWISRASHYLPVNRSGFLISPIRRPEDVWVTWCSSERKEDFFEVWSLFNQTYLDNDELIIVPVDTDDREDHLSKLSERLKCNIKTNWEPVESRPHRNFIERDLSDIYNLEVVRKYYG